MKRTYPSNFKNIVGERVRLARVSQNPAISQDDLAGKLARLGVQMTQASLSKLESRQRYVLDYEVLAISKALKVDLKWLYGEASKDLPSREASA